MLKILNSASRSSLVSGADYEDEDVRSYLAQLRDCIIECYVSIVHGVSQNH